MITTASAEWGGVGVCRGGGQEKVTGSAIMGDGNKGFVKKYSNLSLLLLLLLLLLFLELEDSS